MNFYEGKEVLIPGGAGMTGQALIRKLYPLGAKITATEYKSRKIENTYRKEIDYYPDFDLRTAKDSELRDLYEGIHVVFWAAASVGGASAILNSPSELIQINLEMTSRNLKIASESGVERWAYISSSYAYPDLPYPAKEDDINSGDVPTIHYGLGHLKRYVETLLRHYSMTTQMKAAIIRPTAIYGPFDNFDLTTSHALPALLRKVVEKKFPLEVWGDGSEVRQWTYVDDVVEGLLVATAHYCVAEPLNICTSETRTVKDMAETLLGLEGHDTTDIKYLADKPKVINKRLSDPSKAKRLLGVECRTSLKDGLYKTIEWFKANRP